MDSLLEFLATAWNVGIYTTSGGETVTVGQLLIVAALILAGFYGGRVAQRIVHRRLAAVEFQRDAAYAIERILFYSIIVVVVMTALIE